MGWQRAWHGPELEALYFTAFYGRLFGQLVGSQLRRFFQRAPGVYLHKDATRHNTDYYTRFVQLVPFGTFFCNQMGGSVEFLTLLTNGCNLLTVYD